MITEKKQLVLVMLAATALTSSPAHAQQSNAQMKLPNRANHTTQKAEFYKMAPQIQIIDESPIVHDFREPPRQVQSIQLPPAPGASYGNDGSGSGPFQIPGGGGPGGGGPGYRNFDSGNNYPLPKADFGHAVTNIPAGGVGPRGILPGGQTTGIHGRVMPFTPNNTAPTMARPAAARPYVAPTPVATYGTPGGGYGASPFGQGANRGGASSAVSGKLMTNLLNKQR